MNTRIQVEHPVTEAVTGIDLVRLQFRVAQGEPLPFAQDEITLTGHAIEARLCAEDASANFMPVTGEIVAWRPGAGEGVRVDHGLREGTIVTPFYDSMLAKIIAYGEDREQARRRLLRALEDTLLAGIVSNRDFLIAALKQPEFVDGRRDDGFHFGDAGPGRRRAAAGRHSPRRAALRRERRPRRADRRAGGARRCCWRRTARNCASRSAATARLGPRTSAGKLTRCG